MNTSLLEEPLEVLVEMLGVAGVDRTQQSGTLQLQNALRGRENTLEARHVRCM